MPQVALEVLLEKEVARREREAAWEKRSSGYGPLHFVPCLVQEQQELYDAHRRSIRTAPVVNGQLGVTSFRGRAQRGKPRMAHSTSVAF